MSEAVPLAKTVLIMERMHAGEVFTTPEKSKEFLDSLNYDEFKQWISFVNGIERGVPTEERGKVGDSSVMSEGFLGAREIVYRPPHQSHRNDLLKLAFSKARSVSDPAMAGLTLGLAINAIHYFDDGNGRTGRMVFALLSRGYDGSGENQAYYSSLLENTKGREVINPNPATSSIDKKIRDEMLTLAREKCGYNEAFKDEAMPTIIVDAYPDALAGEFSPKELAVSEEVDDLGRQMLYETLESKVTMISLMKSFGPERIMPFVRTRRYDNGTYLDGGDFIPTLTQKEIHNWWNQTQGSLKAYVMRMIYVSDRPDAQNILVHYTGTQDTSYE